MHGDGEQFQRYAGGVELSIVLSVGKINVQEMTASDLITLVLARFPAGLGGFVTGPKLLCFLL